MTQRGSLLAMLISMVAMIGCGGNGASNNDQGVSVTFLGLFSTSTSGASNGTPTPTPTPSNSLTGCGQLPQPVSGMTISLDQADSSGAVFAMVGLQNNMHGQFFRADRLILEYYIPGSSVQPPSTSLALNLLAGPAEGGLQSGAQVENIRRPIVTSLPPTFDRYCNRAFAQMPIIPPSILEWISFNKGQLPPTPFDMEVVISLTGLASGGDRYDTNQGAFPVIIVSGVSAAADVSQNSDSGSEAVEEVPASTLSAPVAGDEDAQGLEQLESAFDTESVVEGQ